MHGFTTTPNSALAVLGPAAMKINPTRTNTKTERMVPSIKIKLKGYLSPSFCFCLDF
jgi:hypothetical protein